MISGLIASLKDDYALTFEQHSIMQGDFLSIIPVFLNRYGYLTNTVVFKLWSSASCSVAETVKESNWFKVSTSRENT